MSEMTRRSVVGGAIVTLASCRQFGALTIERLPRGERFAMLGNPDARRVVFSFAADAVGSLTHNNLGKTATELVARGFCAVSLDMPCHGEDIRDGEPLKLQGWRYRVERGEPLMDSFVQRCRSTIDVLQSRGATDFVAFGISRGAYSAITLATFDRRIRRVAGVSPVTDLLALKEFSGTAAQVPELPVPPCPVWLSIKEQDDRVGTPQAVAYSRKSGADIHIEPGIGHGPSSVAYANAARWLAA